MCDTNLSNLNKYRKQTLFLWCFLAFLACSLKFIQNQFQSSKTKTYRYTNADLKSPIMFVFIEKQYSENIAFLILRILELFAREDCKFLKK